ncbi:hypothetical protein, partial [Rhodovarius sp.]|uniref:hypothetical protein n=1 Tax=Rhodovarius sp. TaxID=2972673 RepID=UPI0034A5A3F5
TKQDSVKNLVVVLSVDSEEPRLPPALTPSSPRSRVVILLLIPVVWPFRPQLAPNAMVGGAKLFHCALHPRLNRAQDETLILSP